MIGRIKKYYLRTLGLRGLVAAIKGEIKHRPTLIQMNLPELQFPFFLRVPSSDVRTFHQIFIQREYDFDVRSSPKIIFDAGANIGLASLYFTNRFPEAKIIAIEPEASNLEILRQNCAPYHNIIVIHRALWDKNARINVVDPSLGKWGFMTQARDDSGAGYGRIVHEVEGVTVDKIMKELGIKQIDILKLDIEGAEREVFKDPSPWIGQVAALIVELHERFKPGCNRSFYNGSNGFDQEWLQGENVFLTRKGSCLIRPGSEAQRD